MKVIRVQSMEHGLQVLYSQNLTLKPVTGMSVVSRRV